MYFVNKSALKPSYVKNMQGNESARKGVINPLQVSNKRKSYGNFMTLPNLVFRYGNNQASILKCIMMFLSAAGEGVSE
jgi:hypothetical protein